MSLHRWYFRIAMHSIGFLKLLTELKVRQRIHDETGVKHKERRSLTIERSVCLLASYDMKNHIK